MKKLFVVLLLLGTLIACTTQQPSGNVAGTVALTPPNSSGAQLSGKTVEINMTAKDFEFQPNAITVHKGDRVIIHLKSTDGDHGLGIQDYAASIERVNEGETQTLDFIADKEGTFTFFCNVPCGSGHREMKGTLIVTS